MRIFSESAVRANGTSAGEDHPGTERRVRVLVTDEGVELHTEARFKGRRSRWISGGFILISPSAAYGIGRALQGLLKI